MNWRLAFYLTSFILYCVYALPKNKTVSSHSGSLNEKTRELNKLRKGTTSEKDNTDSDEDSDRHGKLSLVGYEKGPRKILAGDIFTPQEMLPIAVKLMQKVDEPGSGKGFVSSTKYPEELADKLFEAFFMTSKRIVTLKDKDISGIDALQALALSGEVAEEAKEEEEEVEAEAESLPTAYLRGQFVKVNNKPKESKYTLVTKTVDGKPNEAKRRGIPLAKKLQKERHLIINKRRKNEKNEKKYGDNDNKDVRKEKANKSYKRKEQPPKRSQKDAAKCRWRYVCENVTDLDSCRLHTDCAKENSKVTLDDIPVKHKPDEHTLAIKQFRKMLESRNLHSHPFNKAAIDKVESLSEYFNNIIVQNNFETSTAKSNGIYVDNRVNGTVTAKSSGIYVDTGANGTTAAKSSGEEEHQKLRSNKQIPIN